MRTHRRRPGKPLGRKAYGSIPHLPGSRLGPAGHHRHPGQARIATERARDRHDTIIVQEKPGGSCCAAAHIGTGVIALVRSGHADRLTSRHGVDTAAGYRRCVRCPAGSARCLPGGSNGRGRR